ncbi:MAG: leucine-rich repeat protein [Eubacteriales bacterium]
MKKIIKSLSLVLSVVMLGTTSNALTIIGSNSDGAQLGGEPQLVPMFSLGNAVEQELVYNPDLLITRVADGEWLDVDWAVGGKVQFDRATGTITSVETSLTKAIIPSSIDGVAVTTIDRSAFNNAFRLTHVEIPDSVTKIGTNAFSKCANLVSVSLPKNISILESYMFNDCISLESIIIPDSVTVMESGVFNGCLNLMSVKLPNNLVSLGGSMFSGCNYLPEVILPDTLTSIGSSAFNHCRAFTSLKIPAGVTEIGGSAFRGCENLKEMILPEGITVLGSYLFQGCYELEKVYIPNSVTTIERNAFMACKKLSKIDLPSTVNEISKEVFYGCDALTSIQLPNGLLEISEKTFAYCDSLSTVSIPNTVEKIGASAFTDCLSLTSITIPENVSTIERYAFGNCPKLTSVFLTSDTVIEDEAFFNSSNVTVYGNTPSILIQGTQYLSYSAQIPNASGSTISSGSIPAGLTISSTGLISGTPTEYGVFQFSLKNNTGSANYTLEIAKNIFQNSSDQMVTHPITTNLMPKINVDSLLGAIGESSFTIDDNNYGLILDPGDGSVGIGHYRVSEYKAFPSKSYMVETAFGYSRIEEFSSSRLVVEQYNKDFQLVSSKVIPQELQGITGFYEGYEHYFVLFEQSNYAEDNDREVIRVVKYDKFWNRLDSLSISNINTVLGYSPVSVAEADGKLLLHMSHTMYTASDGLNHQANMRFTVDIDSMTLLGQGTSVANYGVGYVSHSFQQFVDVSSDGMTVTMNHGDAHPRSVVLFQWPSTSITGSSPSKMVEVLDIEGISGENTTGVQVGGMEIGSNAVIVAGTTVTQNQNFASNKDANIFVTVTSKNNFSESATTLKMITNYDGTTYASCPYLIEITEDKFVLLWSERPTTGVVCWAIIDGSGNVGKINKSDGYLSEVKPIVTSDGNLLWYATNNAAPIFYTLNVSTNKITEGVALNSTISEGASTWAIPHITQASQNFLLDGLDTITANYQKDITRHEFAELLMNCYDLSGGKRPSITGSDMFNDIEFDDLDIIHAKLLGIVSGTSLTQFSPNANITRQEMAVMVQNLSKLFVEATPNNKTPSFADSNSIASWALESISYAQEIGALAGNENNEVRPTDNLSCEQAITVVNNLFLMLNK